MKTMTSSLRRRKIEREKGKNREREKGRRREEENNLEGWGKHLFSFNAVGKDAFLADVRAQLVARMDRAPVLRINHTRHLDVSRKLVRTTRVQERRLHVHLLKGLLVCHVRRMTLIES